MGLIEFHAGHVGLAVFLAAALAFLALTLAIRGRHRAAALYRKHFSDRRRERQFLAAISFYFSFAAVRFVAHAIRADWGPFRDVEMGGRHIHHMVFGIALLLAAGYAGLLEHDSGRRRESHWPGRALAVLYGAGAALTLDEFALWLNLRDVYWERQGRESIDAVLLFGSLLIAALLGGRYVRALWREAMRPFAAAGRVAVRGGKASSRLLRR